ncbi:hypothetical protein [Paenibacillus xerothermodurans]|uniref:Uncharacterized protein n=1 Tax=Paenibacillus xerothermodurans TaxID=1977292 RepID=A0A2W1NSF9_PAEXE|nr:hypothetical protein [Paenibacillus xerothermodurans]PZE20686.1 hypothetical protein CBW46_010940 [Paenibacillus xerothermodurans]
MNRVLLLFFVVLMFLNTTGFQADRYVTTTTHNRLKFAINRGAHDASLQLDKAQLAEGKIVFERDAALLAFKAGMNHNLQLHENGTPRTRSLLSDAPEIVFEDYVDDNDANIVFPFSYVRENQGIRKVLKGPAVIYKVKVRLPRHHVYSYEGHVYKTVIYEYPFRERIVN